MDLDFKTSNIKTVKIITVVLSLSLTSLNKALVNIAAVRSEHRHSGNVPAEVEERSGRHGKSQGNEKK